MERWKLEFYARLEGLLIVKSQNLSESQYLHLVKVGRALPAATRSLSWLNLDDMLLRDHKYEHTLKSM